MTTTTAVKEETKDMPLPVERRRPKVLLVDDEVSFTDMLKLNLELETDYQIYVENDSTRATETAERVVPDMILLDAIMPELDGFEVLQHLEIDPITRNIPVIFLTAISNTLSFPTSELSEIVERETLGKPVKIKNLVGAIERHLDHNRLSV